MVFSRRSCAIHSVPAPRRYIRRPQRLTFPSFLRLRPCGAGCSPDEGALFVPSSSAGRTGRFPFPQNLTSGSRARPSPAWASRAKYLLADLLRRSAEHLGDVGLFHVLHEAIRRRQIPSRPLEWSAPTMWCFTMSTAAIVTFNDPRRSATSADRAHGPRPGSR